MFRPVQLHIAHGGEYYFLVLGRNGEVLVKSTDGYVSRDGALNGVCATAEALGAERWEGNYQDYSQDPENPTDELYIAFNRPSFHREMGEGEKEGEI